MANMTGYDASKVSRSLTSMQSAYNGLSEAIGTGMQNFITEMGKLWACPDAQKFFGESFSPVIDGLIKNSNDTFKSVSESINSAGKAWANQTQSTYNEKQIDLRPKTMEYSCVQSQASDGTQGIDLAQAKSLLATLPKLASEAENALSDAKSSVANSGFIGGEQQTNLTNSLNAIKVDMGDAFRQITDDAKKAMEDTIQRYSDTEGKISKAFTIQ